MILNERSDFENEEELLNTMKNSNIDTIRLEGSSITSLPKFSGIQLVETFECFLSCEIPESYFHHNRNIKKVYIGERIPLIGKSAFSYSTLEFISFSGSPTINENAFYNCKHLITILPNICSMFDRSAFSFTNILSITIALSANSNDRQTISSFAFSGCHNLETVTIRMSSFSIGGSAFNDCFNLKNIIFPENYYISYIGSYAFENCPLESFNFKSVNSLEKGAFRNTNLREVELNLGSLRDDVFEYCSNLINVKIENELSIMESKGIFKNCHSLETVDLGPLSWTCREMFSNCYNLIEVKSSISYVGIHDETFYSCINLKILKLNPSNIGNKAFMFCNSLAYINLTETVLIKSRAFYGCQNLASVSPQVFGDEYAFAFCNSIISCNVQTFAKTGLMMNCSKLESVVIHNIQYIPDKMFYGCSSLKNIEFPDIIKFIGHYAFMGTSIEVPFLDLSETNQIGNYSFKGTKIERIKIGKDFVYSGFQCDFYYRDRCWGNEDTDENPFKDVTTITEIILGSGKQKFRRKDFQDSNNANITLGQYSYFRIENGMMIQDNEIFYHVPAASNKTLTIPNYIRKIHPYAFSASRIEEIVINNYISISANAFKGCKYLKSITINIDQQTMTLGYSIFENCISLVSINLQRGVERIENDCFRRCIALETITIPEGMRSIGSFCFAECISLKNIVFPSNYIYISSCCFYKCVSLSHFNLPKSSVNFGSYVFDSTSISSVTIPDRLEYGLFNMCDKLEKVEFASDISIYSIPEYCFNSTGLSEITVPSSVSRLEKFCFAFTKLKKFVITKSITWIHPQAFYGVEDLELEISCDHPKYLLGTYELIEKETYKLVMTYRKLLSTYIVPSYVKEIGNNAINSYPKYNYTTGKVIDFGLTTLVIRTKLIIEQNPIFNAPYLHNLCYGGNVKVDGFLDVPRIFVSDIYIRSIWNEKPRKEVIFSECDSAVPFENYAKYDYTYPKNPRYIDLPNETNSRRSEKCPITVDPDEPEVEPEISRKEEEFHPKEEERSSSSSQINSENIEISEDEQFSEFVEITHISPTKSKTPTLIYILIPIAVIEILVIVWLIVYMISMKAEEISEKSFQEETEHAITEMTSQYIFTNPLYSVSKIMEDDPFENDFEEAKSTFGGYFNENCLVDE